MLFAGLGCATRGDGLDVAASSPTRGIVVIPASGKLLFPGAGRGAGRKENEAGARRCLSASGGTVVLDLCSRSGDGNVSHFTDEETEALVGRTACRRYCVNSARARSSVSWFLLAVGLHSPCTLTVLVRGAWSEA